MTYRIPFSGRAHNFTDSERQAVLRAMDESVPLTQGQYLKEFETAFKEYSGAKHCFAVNSATSALELCAQYCQFEEGDEFVIPSHTFTSSAYPFVKKGGKPVWADIDLHTRVTSIDHIRPLVNEKTRAIIIPHLYGYVVDMDPILEFAAEKGVLVIEDAAQVIGCVYKGRLAGTLGDLGVFSFHSHKNITTLGEGGMISIKDDEMASILPMLRHNGHCGFNFERENYWEPAMGNVDLPRYKGKIMMPNNYCIGEVECALGIELLKRVEELNQQKRERALKFIDAVSEFECLEIHRDESKRHNYHLLVGRMVGKSRNEFISRMSGEFGVQVIIQYCPLHRYDFYKKLGFGEAQVPNTDLFYDNMVSFPFHHCLSDEDFESLLECTIRVLKSL